MSRESFDVVVIGGGITGAGVALDAATRGLRVALIEKADFGSGTSSRSSKLIHGGLRYLQRLELGLVRESLHERETLRRIAPHLARKLAFVVPVYDPPIRSPLGASKFKIGLGLSLYDLLAGRQSMGRHFWIEQDHATAFAAGLRRDSLRGCFVYYDGLTDDSRLVIEIIKEAAARGAAVANYAAAVSIDATARGSAVEVQDQLGGGPFDLRARVIVNATGVWSDEVTRMSVPGAPPALRPSKGVHIVIPFDAISVTSAVLIPSLGEDRFLFVIPWHGRVVIGTTDSDYEGDLNDPKPTEGEISRLIESARFYFPDSNLSRKDVISSFAGLRPLAAGGGTSTDLSRRERILENESGLISVIGGKLTTYRHIAERVVDRACQKLGRVVSSNTRNLELAGGFIDDSNLKEFIAENVTRFGVDAETVSHLVGNYGAYFKTVLEIALRSPQLKQRLLDHLSNIEAEVIYSARHEMAMNSDDFLQRRSRIALLVADGGQTCRARVEELLRSQQ
jgi:glycerol-3-phosphate dehydrogenase